MALETPPTPTYGPNTFTDLATLAQVLIDNDEYLEQKIDSGGGGGGGGVDIETETISFASGYSRGSYTAYTLPKVTKIDTLVTLEGGLVATPSSFGGQIYYTWGYLPAGFAPTDGLHRMGTAHLYNGPTGNQFLTPVQFRVNQNGDLQFLPLQAISQVSYMILDSMSWTV